MDRNGQFTVTKENLTSVWVQKADCGFYIPDYQRSFVWKEDCDIFFDNVVDAMKEFASGSRDNIYIGNIITFRDSQYQTFNANARVELPEEVLAVVDGQQRLTTLMASTVFLHKRISELNERSKGTWLVEHVSKRILHKLKGAFEIERGHGNWPHYPKMIRALGDQWSTDLSLAKYVSPISALIHSYGKSIRDELTDEPNIQPAVAWQNSLQPKKKCAWQILQPIEAIIGSVCTVGIDSAVDDFVTKPHVIRLLCKLDEWDNCFDPKDGSQRELLNSLFLASYLLEKVLFSFHICPSEQQSFDIFEAQNTTGQPLTALETLKPDVRIFEGKKYRTSISRTCFDGIDEYIAKAGGPEKQQKRSSELVVGFALAESGKKLSNRLSEQRQYLKDNFRRVRYLAALNVLREDMNGSEVDAVEEAANKAADTSADDPINSTDPAVAASTKAGRAFILFLYSFAAFMEDAWDNAFKHERLDRCGILSPNECRCEELRSAGNKLREVQLCLKYLRDSGHKISRSLMARFYFAWLTGKNSIDDLFDVVRATAAFFAIWRASRAGTEGIDDYHRRLFNPGIPDVIGCLRRDKYLRPGTCFCGGGQCGDNIDLSVSEVKAAFVHILQTHDKGSQKKIRCLEDFQKNVSKIPLYRTHRKTAKFLLLVAHHEAKPSFDNPGCLEDAENNCPNMLVGEHWDDPEYKTVWHVIPLSSAKDDEEKDRLHRLGNLTLLLDKANTLLGGRIWEVLKVIGEIQTAVDVAVDIEKIREELRKREIELSKSDIEILIKLLAIPMLQALIREKFLVVHIEERSNNLCERSWGILYKNWLNGREIRENRETPPKRYL